MEFHENAFQKKPPKTLLTNLVNCNEWSLIQNMLVIHGEEHLHMYVLSGQGDLEFINKKLPLNARTPTMIISSVRMQEYWREKMEKISPMCIMWSGDDRPFPSIWMGFWLVLISLMSSFYVMSWINV